VDFFLLLCFLDPSGCLSISLVSNKSSNGWGEAKAQTGYEARKKETSQSVNSTGNL